MLFGFYGWRKPAYTIPANTWVRVVFVNDGNGNFTMPKGSYNTSALNGGLRLFAKDFFMFKTFNVIISTLVRSQLVTNFIV